MLAKTEETEGTTKAKASDVTKVINKTKFGKLLKSQRSQQGDMDEIRGTMGNEMKTAVEKDNLDKAMFAIVRRLHKMTPEKLAYHLPNLFLYVEYADLEKIAADAPPLPVGGQDDEE